jgi:hypothetical protein
VNYLRTSSQPRPSRLTKTLFTAGLAVASLSTAVLLSTPMPAQAQLTSTSTTVPTPLTATLGGPTANVNIGDTVSFSYQVWHSGLSGYHTLLLAVPWEVNIANVNHMCIPNALNYPVPCGSSDTARVVDLGANKWWHVTVTGTVTKRPDNGYLTWSGSVVDANGQFLRTETKQVVVNQQIKVPVMYVPRIRIPIVYPVGPRL